MPSHQPLRAHDGEPQSGKVVIKRQVWCRILVGSVPAAGTSGCYTVLERQARVLTALFCAV